MPRTKRVTPGSLVYHALNRGVGRMALFHADGDYQPRCGHGEDRSNKQSQ